MTIERTALPVQTATLTAGQRRIRRVKRFAREQPLGVLGSFIILLVAFLAIAGDVVTPYDTFSTSPTELFEGPSRDHWFGTDNFGRDYFTRIVAGARVTVTISITSMFLGTLMGTFLGVVSAYLGGVFDLLFQRVIDAMLALPTLIVAMLLIAVFGSSITSMITVLALAVVPGVSRLARAATFGVLAEQYIEAAIALGSSSPRLMIRHVVPNITAPISVIVTTGIGGLILAESSLSFLGLGLGPPTAAWGQMLSSSREFAVGAPMLAVYPGLAIGITVLGFNLLGDALRDVLDPRMR